MRKWKEHWGGMPKFVAENKRPFHTLRVILTKQTPPAGKSHAFVTVHFQEEGLEHNVAEVAEKLGQTLTLATEQITLNTDEQGLADLLFAGHKIGHHSTWFPWKGNDPHSKYVYRQEAGRVVNPEYPVYIISKGPMETSFDGSCFRAYGGALHHRR